MREPDGTGASLPATPSTSVHVVTFTWRHARLRAKHTHNFRIDSCSRLELAVIAPKGAPCPSPRLGVHPRT